MTIAKLLEILKSNGVEIDGFRQGAGKFRDLEIGVGESYELLNKLRAEIVEEGHNSITTVTRVTNPDHRDFGKYYLELGSFWWE